MTYSFFYMTVRCTRWYHPEIVADREEKTLIDAIDSWVKVHGPPKEFHIDSETAAYVGGYFLQYCRKQIKMPVKYVLSETTFCTNALLTVNGMTPYNAVYGRVPYMLPGRDQPDAMKEDSFNMPGSNRHTHRLRGNSRSSDD